MKNYKAPLLNLLLFAIVLCFAFSTAKNKTISSEQSGSAIGDVVYSILSPDLFAKQHSGKWVLLDGKPLDSETQLFQLLESNNITGILQTKGGVKNLLPDASGVFIRGMNNNRDAATGDADGNRQVGSQQMDAFQGHKHFAEASVAMRKNNDADWDRERPTTNAPEAVESEGKYKFNDAYGVPRLSSETRPRNITLYTFIKVSN